MLDLQHLKVELLEIVFLKNIRILQSNGKMVGIMQKILKITMLVILLMDLLREIKLMMVNQNYQLNQKYQRFLLNLKHQQIQDNHNQSNQKHLLIHGTMYIMLEFKLHTLLEQIQLEHHVLHVLHNMQDLKMHGLQVGEQHLLNMK